MRPPYLILHPDAAGRATDFRHPLEVLENCHDHIAHYCYTLRTLLHCSLQTAGYERRAQDKAGNILRWFENDGRWHHSDEELDLFPRILAATDGAERERVGLLIAQLASEHREIESLWRTLQGQLQRIANGESAGLSDLTVEEFEALHRSHMRIEEQQLMPLARSLLSPVELALIGESMAARRRVEGPPASSR